jgi:hypothetical protein
VRVGKEWRVTWAGVMKGLGGWVVRCGIRGGSLMLVVRFEESVRMGSVGAEER